MKKRLYLFAFVLFFFSITSALIAYDTVSNANDRAAYFTPIRLNFFPGVWAWPDYCNIYGLNLGLVNSSNELYSGNEYIVAGLDAAWFISLSNNIYGLQLSPLNRSENSAALQLGACNTQDKSAGAQFGLVNISEDSALFQLGVFNKANKESSVFQLGLINVLDNGFLPFFPIINFTVK